MSASVTFASKSENITIAEKFMDDIRTEAKIGDKDYEDILVALTEAANNAIKHGNGNDAAKNVQICCRLDEQSYILSLIIKDEGPGFDFHNIPDPTLFEPATRPDGRGVFLMKHLAQAIFFSNKGATVDMLFSL